MPALTVESRRQRLTQPPLKPEQMMLVRAIPCRAAKVRADHRRTVPDLMKAASDADQIRQDSKNKIDVLSGHVGGLKQKLEQLQQTRNKLTPAS